MTPKEVNAILDAVDGEAGFTPRFSEHFKVHTDAPCVVCKCHVNDHWMKLKHAKEGWVGCTGALLKRVQQLEGQILELLVERDSRLRGDLTREKSGTPAVESRVDGDAA